MDAKEAERKALEVAMYERFRYILSHDTKIMDSFVTFYLKIKQDIELRDKKEVEHVSI